MDLYGRLMEGIGEGIAKALTRKPVDSGSGNPGDIDVLPPEDSSSFSKHSRDWYTLNEMLNRINLDTCYSAQMSKDDFLFLRNMIYHGDSVDDEVWELFHKRTKQRQRMMLITFIHIGVLVRKMLFHEHLNDMEFDMTRILKTVTKDHPLYACYVMRDNPKIDIYSKRPQTVQQKIDTLCSHTLIGDHGNLNWLDMRYVWNMSNMFYKSTFNGDISAWDVSRVLNMKYMFKKAHDFDCDLSKWEISPECEVTSMFERCGISDEHIPERLRGRTDIK